MANEFKHKDVGASLTEAEYDAVDAHEFDSQAQGDILCASSASQLSRLAAGNAGQQLTTMGVNKNPEYNDTIIVESGMLTAGAQHAKIFAWQNTKVGGAVLVIRVLIHITTPATAAARINVGHAVTDSEADNLIDGGALDAVDILDNIDNQGTNGTSAVLVDDDEYVTGYEDDSAASTDLVGRYYICYTPVRS